jgi:hypothetical protein
MVIRGKDLKVINDADYVMTYQTHTEERIQVDDFVYDRAVNVHIFQNVRIGDYSNLAIVFKKKLLNISSFTVYFKKAIPVLYSMGTSVDILPSTLIPEPISWYDTCCSLLPFMPT